jgi:hypothetical protein
MDAIVSCKLPEYRPSLRPAAARCINTHTARFNPREKGIKETQKEKRRKI